MNAQENLIFGDFVKIEQLRFGVPNEFYEHKVIGTLKSNNWVDVPVKSPEWERCHDEPVDVVSCICCGVQERYALYYRIEDVEKFGPLPF